MDGTCRLHLAHTEDVDKVYRLVQGTIRACYATCYTPAVTEAFCRYHSRESIATDIADGRVYVLIDNGIQTNSGIVGTATVDGSYIGRVYVAPERQGEGHGTLLMDAMEELVAADNPRATLDSSVPGRDFYLRRGYIVARTETWEIEPYGSLPADQLVYEVMEKRLT